VVLAHQALSAAGQGDLIWGHAAVRASQENAVWTKSAGWGFDEMTSEKAILVSGEGEILSGSGTRHIEYVIHTAVMTARSDVECVVHTHAEAVTAFAALDVPLRAVNHDGVLFANGGLPRYPGGGNLIRSRAQGAELARALGDAPACLLPRHGLVAVGRTPAEAVMRAVLLERACRVQLTAMAAGDLRDFSDEAESSAKADECWNSTQIDGGWRYLLRRAATSRPPASGRVSSAPRSDSPETQRKGADGRH
jgi:ribulose-5-phosphate 4-epimerase/fuculose-1-phosphate aldolase